MGQSSIIFRAPAKVKGPWIVFILPHNLDKILPGNTSRVKSLPTGLTAPERQEWSLWESKIFSPA